MQGRTQERLSLFSILFLLFAATLFTFAQAAPQVEPSSEPDDVVVEDGGDLTSAVDEGIPTETAAILGPNEDGTPEELPANGTVEIEPDESGKANTTEITQDIIIEETKQDPLDDKEKKEIEAEIEDAAALFEGDVAEKRDVVDLDTLEERDADDLEEPHRLDTRCYVCSPLCRFRCRILARVLRGFVPWSARRFRQRNPGIGMRPHSTHMFFLYPLHRSLFDASIHPRLWFNANWVGERFWIGAGATFLKRVYVRARYAPFLRQSSATSQTAFFNQTWLLAHEYQHVRQYQACGWNLLRCGYQYIYEWCVAGKNFRNNAMEVSADRAADKLLPLLKTERRFFRFWQRDWLRLDLGYPVETSYRNAGTDIRQLSFQHGAMQLDTRRSCYRKRTTGGWGPWDCRSL